MSDRILSSLFTARVIRAAAGHGAPEAALWRCAGVRPEGDDFPPIREERHLAVWRLAMQLLDDPEFPIAYARSMSIDDYGLLGLACKTAPSVGGALAVLEQFLGVYADTIGVAIEHGRRSAAVVLVRPGIPDLGLRCAIESTLAEVLGGMRAVSARPLVPRAVLLAHSAPRATGAHASFFGVAPRFGAARNALELAPGVLELPAARADRALHRYLVRELEALAAARTVRRSAAWSEQVRGEILRTLPRAPQLACAARALAVSPRSLQRHLRAEQTTFDRVADRARLELSRALLADPGRSVLEVAVATGFAETSSFVRAFRRWTGTTPRARPAHRPASPR